MQRSTNTNMTSDQWSYLHKNVILLVIVLVLKHVLFRLMQQYLRPVINCLLCCMTGILGVSFAVRIVSLHDRIVFV